MNTPTSSIPECDRIRERYARRQNLPHDRYSPLAHDVMMTQQEKHRAIVRLLKRVGLPPLGDKKVLEVGCGTGANLHYLLSLGFQPENLVGNDLLEDRCVQARRSLPAAVRIIPGDATTLSLEASSFDIVLQSTVFSSILDQEFRQKLARLMWQLVRPGGGILWYNFMYNNPRNPDVRGVSFQQIERLFPEGCIQGKRITLAPPLARAVAPIHAGLYTLLNAFPFLRTHWLCWIQK